MIYIIILFIYLFFYVITIYVKIEK
jgi:hypothetical protein